MIYKEKSVPKDEPRLPKLKRKFPFQRAKERCKGLPKEKQLEVHRTELLDHLKIALQLEHATIPPYLCALYSIKDGTNLLSAQRIRSVAVEEMLHMALVANLTHAIGGKPSVIRDKFIPTYPTDLPNSDGRVKVSLNSFSSTAIDVFLDIERPMDIDAKPMHDEYSSIGQFYAAIKDELDDLHKEFKEEDVFIGDPAKQVSSLAYYSGGGEIVPVTNYDSARRAIKIIVDEGEGFGHSIFSGDHEQFGERPDLAHYYKFNEIAVGRTYMPDDSPAGNPTGPTLAVDFTESYPAVFHQKVKEYPNDVNDVEQELKESNRTYSRLLRAIDGGFNDEDRDQKLMHFEKAVILMYEVREQMKRLMKIPIDKKGNTAGPTFIYVDE